MHAYQKSIIQYTNYAIATVNVGLHVYIQPLQ